jgi:hypothetical protein
MTVRVIEPDVAIVEATGGYVALKNTGTHEADISGYVLREQTRTFVFPKGTVLLPGGSVRFPSASTGIVGGAGTTLYHPTGALVSVFGTPFSAPQATKQSATTHAPSEVATVSGVATPTVSTSTTPATVLTSVPYEPAVGTDTDTPRPLWWWLIGLASAILATVVVVLIVRRDDEPERIAGFEIEIDSRDTV